MRANCLHFRTSNTESSSNSHTRCSMSDVCWMCYCRPIEWFRYNRRKRDKLKNFSQSYTKLFGNRHNKNGNDWCARWMVHIELWWADALAGWQLSWISESSIACELLINVAKISWKSLIPTSHDIINERELFSHSDTSNTPKVCECVREHAVGEEGVDDDKLAMWQYANIFFRATRW